MPQRGVLVSATVGRTRVQRSIFLPCIACHAHRGKPCCLTSICTAIRLTSVINTRMALSGKGFEADDWLPKIWPRTGQVNRQDRRSPFFRGVPLSSMDRAKRTTGGVELGVGGREPCWTGCLPRRISLALVLALLLGSPLPAWAHTNLPSTFSLHEPLHHVCQVLHAYLPGI
jgi:hypothetical protein